MDTLPDELVGWIASYLPAHDLTNVARASRWLDQLVTPRLWERIEMHPRGYHIAIDLKHPPAAVPEDKRPYLCNDGVDLDVSAEIFFQTLHQTRLQGKGRLQLLCSRIRSICTVLEPSWTECGEDLSSPTPPIWQIFPYFVNLEVLELDVRHDWAYDSRLVPRIEKPPLARLRCAKLFGYIPPGFAAWILSARFTLQRLELGMLDRPISSDRETGEWASRPLPSENLLLDEDGGNDDDLYEGSDYGSLDGDCIIPRPLSGFVTLMEPVITSTKESAYPVLKYLYLSQPSRCDYGEDSSRDYQWSLRAENTYLADWKQLLLAASSALEVLVLEQRPAAEQIEPESFTSAEFIERNGQGVGSETLVQMVLDCLEVTASFPLLKEVYLYGIAVEARGEDIARSTIPGANLMWRLKARGIRCEARLGMWLVFDRNSGVSFGVGHYPDDDDLESRDVLLAKT